MAQVGTTTGTFQELSLQITADREGYVLIYTANQTAEDLDVFIDDLLVEHIESPVIRTDDYYPFGLAFNSSKRTGVLTNKYLYNGKELQTDLNLDLYDYGARMYDTQLGRFNIQDAFGEKYFALSPYQYAGLNPINTIDINGDSIWVVFTGSAEQRAEALKIVQKMFKDEFGLIVGHNDKTDMLYWIADVKNTELSQSESATDYLKGALTETNSSSRLYSLNKNGRIEFGFKMGFLAGQAHISGIRIDLDDFRKDQTLKVFDYRNISDKRAYNLARVFEHEYFGHWIMRRFANDGSYYSTGSAVDVTNKYRRERGLPERLHYLEGSDDRMLFGNTKSFENPKAIRKYVKKVFKGKEKHTNYLKRL